MSELLGKETIDLYNTSETRSNQKSFGLNYQKTGKQLMTEDEIAVMDGGKCILQIRGARPFFSDKYDITKHKNYRYLADEKVSNLFSIQCGRGARNIKRISYKLLRRQRFFTATAALIQYKSILRLQFPLHNYEYYSFLTPCLSVFSFELFSRPLTSMPPVLRTEKTFPLLAYQCRQERC